MGQRLNLEIKKKGKVLANAYYHWSAYTGSAYDITATAYMWLLSNKDSYKDDRLLAIRALEETGAGLPNWDKDDDYIRIKNIRKYSSVEFQESRDRNAGIIGCFPNSIKSTQDWAEGTSVIDLDNMTIMFDVLNYYDSVNDIKEWDEDFDEKDAVVFNYQMDELSLGELTDIVNTVCSGKWVFCDGMYISELG